jgi:UDP-glucose 4-epimerase
MKALVTGGAGFIGHHLVEKLISKGWFVHILDNLSTGSLDNLEGLPSDMFEFHEIDLVYDVIPDMEGVSIIYHLAAPVSVPESLEDPAKYRWAILDGSAKLLKWARINEVGTFIAASTAALYGEPTKLPIKETSIPDPLSPYARYKFDMEKTMSNRHIPSLKCTALRFFNVFGEGQRDTGGYASAVPIFLKQYESFQPITVTGDGNQTRDWIYVGDVVKALIKSSEVKTYWKRKMPIYNVGSGIETSVIEVAESFGGEIVHIESRKEPKRSVADITSITESLDWKPETSLLSWIKEVK